METITLHDVLTIIDSGLPFGPIEFVTANKKSRTGGEWIRIPSAVKHEADAKSVIAPGSPAPAMSSGTRKNPRHFEHATRNLMLLPCGNIRKVHIRLITMFNNKIVT